MSVPTTPKAPARAGRGFSMAGGSPMRYRGEHLIVSATPSQRIKTDGSRDDRPSNYILGECLGKGAFATVYKAMNYYTGEAVAIKQIYIKGVPESEVKILMQEIDVVKELNHPNIVKYHGFEKSSDYLNIILEFCETGSLRYLYKEYGKFPEHLVACFINQVLQGLLYLHDQGTIHRDIKGANILTTKGGTIKLADFGVAGKTNALNPQSVVGTPCWMAPEIIQMKGATTASDIWSLGCTIVELLTGNPPFHERDPMSALYAIVKEDPPIPEGVSPQLNDFLLSCFAKEPYLRKTAKDLLRHQWIKNAVASLENQSNQDSGTPAASIQEPPKLHLHDTIRTVKKYNSSTKLQSSSKKEECPTDENKDPFFDPNPLIQQIPNPFSAGYRHNKLNVKRDPSVYRDTQDDDFSDLIGELNMEKALAIIAPGDSTRMRIRDSADVEHIRKHALHLEHALPQKPIDIQQFVEDDDQNWDDYDITGKEIVTKVLRANNHSNEAISADLFVDVDRDYSNFDHIADRNVAREKLATAAKTVESLAAEITDPVSTTDFNSVTHRMYELLVEFPETKNTILKGQALLSLKNALDAGLSSQEVLNALRIINNVCQDDYKTLTHICTMGALRSISRVHDREGDKETGSEAQFQALIFISMLCAEKSGVDMFTSNNGLQFLVGLLRRSRTLSSNPSFASVIVKAVFIVHQILEVQNTEGRSVTCYVILSYHTLTSFVDILKNKSLADASSNVIDREAYYEMLNSIVGISLYLSEGTQNLESQEFNNAKLYKTILHCYKLLDEVNQIKVLKLLKNVSSAPKNHNALDDGHVISSLVRILESSNASNERFHNVAWLILHSIFNLCELNPQRQEKAAATGLVPLLQKISETKMQAREFALQLLLNMAFSTPVTRKHLAQANTLKYYFSLTSDAAWQLMAYRAIDAWLEADVEYVQSRIIDNEGYQKQLVENLSETTIEPFYKILCHSVKICYVISKQSRLYKYLSNCLKGRNTSEIQTALLIIKVILGTRKSRIKDLYLHNFESVLIPLKKDKQNVIGSAIAADILKKISEYKSQFRMH